MTRNEVVDRIVADVQSSIKTSDTRFVRDFVQSHVDSARGDAIQNVWKKFRKIHPQWQQEFMLEYDANIQDDEKCVTKYIVPAYIALDSKTDGMLFIGNSENRSFRIINDRAELSVYLNVPLQSPYTGRFVAVVREGNMIELHYSGRIKFSLENKGKLLMLYGRPQDCPTYNALVDPYPITQDLMSDIEDLLIKKFQLMAMTPMDSTPNKSDYIPPHKQ